VNFLKLDASKATRRTAANIVQAGKRDKFIKTIRADLHPRVGYDKVHVACHASHTGNSRGYH